MKLPDKKHLRKALKPEDIIGDLEDLEEVLREIENQHTPKKRVRPSRGRGVQSTEPVQQPGASPHGQSNQQPTDPLGVQDPSSTQGSPQDCNRDGYGNQQPVDPQTQDPFFGSQQSQDPFSAQYPSNSQDCDCDGPVYGQHCPPRISEHELGGYISTNTWAFAAGILANCYDDCVQQGNDETATVIRSHVHYFFKDKGEHKIQKLPTETLREFAYECCESTDVLSEEDYLMEKMLPSGAHSMEQLIEQANQASKEFATRAMEERLGYRDY